MSVYCKDCKFREKSNLPYDSFFCTHFKGNIEMLGCDEGESKAQTNADRIRSMTDEELASVITDDWCEIVCSGTDYLCDGNCEQYVLKWLKEEVKT